MSQISSEIMRAALDAAFPGLPPSMTLAEAERRVRAGLEAVVPLIRAQVLRDHAEHRHGPNSNRLPMVVFGGVQIPYCTCGMPWYENGCTPRQQLLADAEVTA